MRRIGWYGASASLACGVLLAGGVVAQGRDPLPLPHPDLPEGYQQLLPRGRIPSVDDPRFKTADEAVIPDDAWILGIAHEGEARAYSLEILNHHEVVNDRIGKLPVAAVW